MKRIINADTQCGRIANPTERSHRLEAGIREKLAGIGFNVKEEGV